MLMGKMFKLGIDLSSGSISSSTVGRKQAASALCRAFEWTWRRRFLFLATGAADWKPSRVKRTHHGFDPRLPFRFSSYPGSFSAGLGNVLHAKGKTPFLSVGGICGAVISKVLTSHNDKPFLFPKDNNAECGHPERAMFPQSMSLFKFTV